MAKIPAVSLDVWKDLYAEAMRYESIKPWNILCEESFFGVQDPASGQLGYGCVLGEMGTFLALAVYRGAEGFNIYQRLKNDEIPEDESFAAQNCLMAQFADREELEKADRDNIKKLGLRFRGVQAWPLFRSQLPSNSEMQRSRGGSVRPPRLFFPSRIRPRAVRTAFRIPAPAYTCGPSWTDRLSRGIPARSIFGEAGARSGVRTRRASICRGL